MKNWTTAPSPPKLARKTMIFCREAPQKSQNSGRNCPYKRNCHAIHAIGSSFYDSELLFGIHSLIFRPAGIVVLPLHVMVHPHPDVILLLRLQLLYGKLRNCLFPNGLNNCRLLRKFTACGILYLITRHILCLLLPLDNKSFGTRRKFPGKRRPLRIDGKGLGNHSGIIPLSSHYHRSSPDVHIVLICQYIITAQF